MKIKKGIDIRSNKDVNMFIIGIEFNVINSYGNRQIYLSIGLGYIEVRVGRFLE